MSLKFNFAQTTPITCSLFLLLSSTAWADPKAPVVSVKPSVQTNTTKGAPLNTGSPSPGAGAGKSEFGTFSLTHKDQAPPSLFKDATSGDPLATSAMQYRRTTNEPIPKRKGSPRE